MALLQSIIPAYLYRQYALDDDLAALTSAYNAAAQYYLDWFQSVNLAYYPGLSGDLLDWVAEGLYGQARTALATPDSFALGPIASLTLAQEPLAYYSPPTSTFYSLTDDAFQRILTWNLYKGDGKRFSMRWLKRRIMRFLLGVNGIDPQPGQPGFVIGCENTQAISVTVASHVLTVEINQALLSSLVQITPGILQIFQLAFQAGQAGPLELPLQYESYVCDIVVSLAASVSPNTLTSAGSATTQTTDEAFVLVLGGSGSYTYAWSWATGGSGITINALGSPTGSAVDFEATGMTAGDTYTGTAQCLVTDTVTSDTTTCQVTVSIKCYAALAASISPSSISATGATSSIATGNVTASISGGSGSYSVSWGFSSGGVGIVINAPAAKTTNFTGTGIAAGGSESGTARCTVTDTVTSDQVFPTCAVSVNRVTEVSATVSPSTATSGGIATTQTTNTVTVTASGGSGSYSFSWAILSGPFTVGTPSSATSNFSCSGMTPGTTYTGSARCTVTDGYSQSTYVDVPISITCDNPVYTGSLMAGQKVEGSTTITGYAAAFTIGSLTPSTDYYGRTIEVLGYFSGGSGTGMEIEIAGFGSDPGSAYFATLYIDGAAYAASSAVYSYSSGAAFWTWPVSNPFIDGDSYDITIDYE